MAQASKRSAKRPRCHRSITPLARRRNLFSGGLRIGSESRHSADEFRRNLRCAAEFRGNEDKHLPRGHAKLTVMRCLDAKFTRGSAHLGRPKIECESIAVTRRLGKIDRKMHGRSQDLFVMKQSRRTRGEAVFEPVLDEIADHLEISRVENPPRGVAMPKAHENFTLKCRHRCPAQLRISQSIAGVYRRSASHRPPAVLRGRALTQLSVNRGNQ